MHYRNKCAAKVLLFFELCKSWYYFFTIRMHYFTTLDLLDYEILPKHPQQTKKNDIHNSECHFFDILALFLPYVYEFGR